MVFFFSFSFLSFNYRPALWVSACFTFEVVDGCRRYGDGCSRLLPCDSALIIEPAMRCALLLPFFGEILLDCHWIRSWATHRSWRFPVSLVILGIVCSAPIPFNDPLHTTYRLRIVNCRIWPFKKKNMLNTVEQSPTRCRRKSVRLRCQAALKRDSRGTDRILGGCSVDARCFPDIWKSRSDVVEESGRIPKEKKNKKGENGEMEMMQRGNWSKRGPRRKASVKADVAHRSFNRLLFFSFSSSSSFSYFSLLSSLLLIYYFSLSLCILVPISCILPSLRCDPILIHQCILIPFRWIPLPIGSQLGFFCWLILFEWWLIWLSCSGYDDVDWLV